MNITLVNIERAIRANFILAKDGNKFLETDWYHEWHSKSAARTVYIGVALLHGHKQEHICEHIDMTVHEYNARLAEFRERYSKGQRKEKERNKEEKYGQDDALDLDLRIYRKYKLVTNYLQLLRKVAY